MSQQPNNDFNMNQQYSNAIPPNPNPNPVYLMKKTKSKFLTFVFALMPGAGQMYQGLVQKGISLMALFFGVIALSILLYIPIILFALPVIWFYSFFDVINRSNYSVDELKAVEDSYIIHLNFKQDSKLGVLVKNKQLIIGWAILLVGVYALLNTLVFNNRHLFYYFFEPFVFDFVSNIGSLVPKLVVPVICLLIGVKLIKGTNKNQHHISQINQMEEGQNDEIIH